MIPVYPSRFAKLATCSLKQWALDFAGNKQRIMESIQTAKSQGCTIRLGPELEITGYNCEDHFLEIDTVNHSWEILADILASDLTNDILCSLGMPLIHEDTLYNCTMLVLNKKILLIKPKMSLSDNGNYREGRYFSSWPPSKGELEEFFLPEIIQKISGQKTVPIGNGIIQAKDTEIGLESYEELWQPNPPSIQMGLEGVEIFLNNSAIHHQLREIDTRIRVLTEATQKNGGVYLYANQSGCDGGRLYFDGACMITMNGDLYKIGSQFSLKETEVITCIVDLNSITSKRISFKSRSLHTQKCKRIPKIVIDFRVAKINDIKNEEIPTALLLKDVVPCFEEEIAKGPACYLYDYLRRSGASGFFLPLSGGADSAAVAAVVYNMGLLIYGGVKNNVQCIINGVREIVKDETFLPTSPQEIIGKIFFTCYMGTTNNSSDTKTRAQNLVKEIGATYFDVSIQEIYEKFKLTAENCLGFEAKYLVHGGSLREDLNLQNIQARSRMVLAYLLAGLIPSKYMNNKGFILILSSTNLDEALTGNLTKYDCSSGDINPIGSFAKIELRKFLRWSAANQGLKTLEDIANAYPTPELRPLCEKSGKSVQIDEVDLGVTYEELSVFGQLRKNLRYGPYSMFVSLLSIWKHLNAQEVSEKVKNFFKHYTVNRHKMTTLTPSICVGNNTAEDNRFDLRPFIYRSSWEHQFNCIDQRVRELMSETKETK